MDNKKNALAIAATMILRILLCSVLVATTATAVLGSSFNFPDFSDPYQEQIKINDSAAFVTDSASRSVLRVAPQDISKAGSGWYMDPVSIAFGFNTAFTFNLHGSGNAEPNTADPTADGLAFVIQWDPARISSLSGAGSTIGYGHMDLHYALAIEFDTYFNYYNNETNDPNGNHVAIMRSYGDDTISADHGINQVAVDLNPRAFLDDGRDRQVNISYLPGQISVSLDNYLLFGGPISVDLNSILGSPTAYVGFTAATGGSYQDHDLVNWSFQSIPEPASFSLLGGGLSMIAISAALRKKRLP